MTANKVKVVRWNCTCEKCNGSWQSRTEEKPTICPFCKTRLWERKQPFTPKEKKTK